MEWVSSDGRYAPFGKYLRVTKSSFHVPDFQALKHLEPFFSERSATRVTVEVVEGYKDERRKEGAAPATIKLELAALKRAFNLASHKERLPYKPRITMYRLHNARQGFFEPREYKAILEPLPDDMKCRNVCDHARYTS